MMTPLRRGFTLVETIFSTLFIGVAVLAIVNLFPGAYLSIRKSETALQADIIGKSVLDELRLIPFHVIDSQTKKRGDTSGIIDTANYVGHFEQVGTPFDARVLEGITYTPEVEIYKIPESDFTFLKKVRVVVSYRYRVSPTEKKLVHETYIHKLVR